MWPLDWAATSTKDIVVLVDDAPTNLGAVHSRAAMLATDAGLHIALASTCAPEICMPDDDGYEPIVIDSTDDPLQQAASISPAMGFFRPNTPTRVVLLTRSDTSWSEDTLAADPLLGRAQLDVRTPDPTACGQQPQLEALAAATRGSY